MLFAMGTLNFYKFARSNGEIVKATEIGYFPVCIIRTPNGFKMSQKVNRFNDENANSSQFR